MTATKWNSSRFNLNIRRVDLFEELFPSEDEEPEDLLTEIPIPGKDKKEKQKIPEVLPVLPLRGLVVYPHTAVPLTIGQARSIRLVDEVMSGDERIIALVASKSPELEVPDPKDLYTTGTAAIIHRMFRAQDGTIRLVVQGLARIGIGEYIQQNPYLKAEINPAPEKVEENLELEALARNARDQFEHIADLIPSIPRELVASVLLLDDPLQTIYTIANFQRMELEDAQTLLEIDSITDKYHNNFRI